MKLVVPSHADVLLVFISKKHHKTVWNAALGRQRKSLSLDLELSCHFLIHHRRGRTGPSGCHLWTHLMIYREMLSSYSDPRPPAFWLHKADTGSCVPSHTARCCEVPWVTHITRGCQCSTETWAGRIEHLWGATPGKWAPGPSLTFWEDGPPCWGCGYSLYLHAVECS